MIGTFFKLVVKAFKFSVTRPIQRFNVYSRAKKYLGEDAKYFMPAPRAIGAVSQTGTSQYPHLEGSSMFKSVQQKRLEAISRRNQRLLEAEKDLQGPDGTVSLDKQKSFSETRTDDRIIIESSNKLPTIKTVTVVGSHQPKRLAEDGQVVPRPARPLPTSTNLQLSDPAVIWQVAKVPAGRLDLNKFQELLINKLADHAYWTPKQISETYNIKEEYAENIIEYFKQIQIVLSPGIADKLDYLARNDAAYQAYKDTIYIVDVNLRSATDRQYDDTFLPTDELEPKIRKMLQGDRQLRQSPDPRLTGLFKRPEPLRIEPMNKSTDESSRIDDKRGRRRRLPGPKET